MIVPVFAPTLFMPGASGFANLARKFNGTSDTIEMSAGTAVLNPAAPATMAAWVQPVSTGDVFQAVIGGYPGGATDPNHMLYFSSGLIYVSWGTTPVLGSIPLSNGVWAHLAATLIGTTVATYVNGVADNTTTTSHVATSTAFYMAFDDAAGHYGRPAICDAAVWNTALSGAQIAALAAPARANTIGANANLVGYWPITGASPEPDMSGNSFNGTVTGTTIVAGPF